MNLFWSLYLSLFLIAESNPYQAGSYLDSLVEINYGNHSTPGEGVDIHIYIVAPQSANVELPVFSFFTAFAGAVPAAMYLNWFNHIASHGIIVVGMDGHSDSTKVNFQPDLARSVQSTIDWLKNGNMKSLFATNGVTTTPNFDQMVLSGHSAGGHTVTQLIKDGCNGYQGLVLVDPVDGLAPWQAFQVISEISSVIHPPTKVPFQIPLLHIDTFMDPLSAFPDKPNYPSCAPEGMANDRFFNAWQGPAWQINASYYGHMDIVNTPTHPEINHVFDIFCAGNRTSSNTEYIALAGGATVAFMDMIINGNQASVVYLEDSSVMPTAVLLRQEYHDFSAPFGGFCKNL